MEIVIDLFADDPKKKLLSAQFTMVHTFTNKIYNFYLTALEVARDEYNKAYKVPELMCETDEEKKRQVEHQAKVAARKKVNNIVALMKADANRGSSRACVLPHQRPKSVSSSTSSSTGPPCSN